jgi:hypothetical protein
VTPCLLWSIAADANPYSCILPGEPGNPPRRDNSTKRSLDIGVLDDMRVASVLIGILLISVPLLAQSPPASVAERFLLAAANQDRAARNLPLLRVEDHLVLAARQHAFEMARRRTISHQFEGEGGLAERAGAAGANFSLVTENVAEAPNSAEIHDLWMHSAGHRANLLDPKVDAVGIAVVWSRGEFYAVEDFAHTVEQLSLTEQEATVSSLIANAGLQISPPSQDARQTCLLATGYAGARKPWFVMRYTSSDIHRLPEELSSRIATGRYREAAVGACLPEKQNPFTSYSLAVLLYP